jgi:hypothetical protein
MALIGLRPGATSHGTQAMHFDGEPSDRLPGVLATGESDAGYVFLSLSARDPAGRDADYIAWHTLDHRPEQYRLPGIRNSLRLVSTPACRAARAASAPPYEALDHVMTYQFTDAGALPGFGALGAALAEGGRMPHRLPSLGFLTATRAGKVAAPRVVAGADVIPWRPSLGVYLMIERGEASPAELIDLPGVAGIWWYRGDGTQPFGKDSGGLQITYCYLDADPVAAAGPLGERMRRRWASGAVEGLLAAPFYTIVPFDWSRHLP